MIEEQQIQAFVHKVASDTVVRGALLRDPEGVIQVQDVSPRVSQILAHLVPYLALDKPLDSNEKWWHV